MFARPKEGRGLATFEHSIPAYELDEDIVRPSLTTLPSSGVATAEAKI